MADNRYRKGSPPGPRRYNNDPFRASTSSVYSSSFDPAPLRGGSVDPYSHTRHGSLYDTQPVKRYSYQDNAHGPTISSTHYAIRPRTNSTLPALPENRRPSSMVVKNTSPTRNRPLVSNSSRDDPRSPVLSHAVLRDEPARYLVPASSQGREHHQRHYSANRADAERLNPSVRSSRSRPEYHQAGGYSSKAYAAARVKDDDFSYTGPREQFARDYPARPSERRESTSRRERPASVYDLGAYKDTVNVRRDLGPPPVASSRQLDRFERSDGGRLSIRPAYESDPEKGNDLPTRRQSVRAPVVHQTRDDDYRNRDDLDVRLLPRPRRDRIEEEELVSRPRRDRIEEEEPVTRPRRDRIDEEDLAVRPRRERIDGDNNSVRPRRERIEKEEEEVPVRLRRDRIEEEPPMRPKRDRIEEEIPSRSRRERLDDIEPVPRARRERVEEDEHVSKARQRDAERDTNRDRDYVKEAERPRDRDYERDRDNDRLRPVDKSHSHADERHGSHSRSRENSPDEAGHGKAVAAGLGGLAAAGLAGAAIKSSSKPEEASDSDSRKERRHRKHRHRDRDEEPLPRDDDLQTDRKNPVPTEDRPDDHRTGTRHDDSPGGTLEEDHERRRRRRHRQQDRDEADISPAADPRAGPDSTPPDRDILEGEDEPRRRRRHSRVREPDPAELEQRTISPGEEEDGRPRKVQLVEPVKDKEDFKPKGILKAPRTVPFPEDPNPTREGVAPLKEAGKDGVPPGARWTKISRYLVNPEALEKAHERFEERDDYVIVLRVVSREEIEKLATKTREIRETREKEWQEELEKRRAQEASNPRQAGWNEANADGEAGPRLLDQVPANPSFDPRAYNNAGGMMPNPPVAAMPVPDIKLESVEASNYSTNV